MDPGLSVIHSNTNSIHSGGKQSTANSIRSGSHHSTTSSIKNGSTTNGTKNGSTTNSVTAEVLEAITEEQTPAEGHACTADCPDDCNCRCRQIHEGTPKKEKEGNYDEETFQKALADREEQLRKEFKTTLTEQTNLLKERFNFILHNEQIRATYKLRETHRERKEKIQALRQQLECKNMAALMYVMCAERNRSKYEKLKLIETYTNYINMLNDVLTEGQALILNLSRGYKTAARVDYEWQVKMRKVVKEFLAFIHNFTNTTPEQGQYFFDLPKLLQTESPKEDNPEESPIYEEEEEPERELETQTQWWQRLDEHNRPFVVYGDMADFLPERRRATLATVKAAKTAPKRWTEYAFHDAFLKSNCPNLEAAKDELLTDRGEGVASRQCSYFTKGAAHGDNMDPRGLSVELRTDMKANMGSILKIITTNPIIEPVTKAVLLGAKDSMEIGSTTKLREKGKNENGKEGLDSATPNLLSPLEETVSKLGEEEAEKEQVRLNPAPTEMTPNFEPPCLADHGKRASILKDSKAKDDDDNVKTATDAEAKSEAESELPREHTDSLQVLPTRVPEKDHKINVEKICPAEFCKLKTVDSFTRSLPAYMKENTYHYFEQTYDTYEPCTKEQLEILKQRLDEKKKLEKDKDYLKEKRRESVRINSEMLQEWQPETPGMATQTSDVKFFSDSGSDLPPCTCRDSQELLREAGGAVFNVSDLVPVKMKMDNVKKDCMFDTNIDLDRFKVVGQESVNSLRANRIAEVNNQDFTSRRVRQIMDILKQHPSLADIFQANTKDCK